MGDPLGHASRESPDVGDEMMACPWVTATAAYDENQDGQGPHEDNACGATFSSNTLAVVVALLWWWRLPQPARPSAVMWR